MDSFVKSFSVSRQHSEPYRRVVRTQAAVVEFLLGVSAVGGGAPYFAHHIKRVSGLIETALNVQVCPPSLLMILPR